MTRQKKQRFYIELNDTKKEIVSCLERPNLDLVIGINHAKNYADGTAIDSQHYSVHQSPKSDPPQITLTHNLKLKDGRDIKTRQARYRHREPFQALIFTRSGPSFEPKRYDLRMRGGDKAVPLYPKDTSGYTTVLAVAVGVKDADACLLDGIGMTVTRYPYTLFDLHIGIAFITEKPFDQGLITHGMTSTPRVNDIAIGPEITTDLAVLTKEQINNLAIPCMERAPPYCTRKLLAKLAHEGFFNATEEQIFDLLTRFSNRIQDLPG